MGLIQHMQCTSLDFYFLQMNIAIAVLAQEGEKKTPLYVRSLLMPRPEDTKIPLVKLLGLSIGSSICPSLSPSLGWVLLYSAMEPCQVVH